MRQSLVLVLLALVACDVGNGLPPEDPGNATFKYRASAEQIAVWKAPVGEKLELKMDGSVATTGIADEQGSFVFRKLKPGHSYVVQTATEHTRAMKIVSPAESQPAADFYKAQKLVKGFQYLTMRDGTKLSAYVTMPGAPEDGPYPTVVNYSGYNPSEPGGPMPGYEAFCQDIPVLCDAPSADASLFAGFMGFATINVNIRGTGCSGGAYDYFETLQLLDGYDVVEIAASQEWVLNHKVGMVGLSYPGITQLFVAKMHPPGLAAITPLSVIGNTATTLVPGGILNDGFAISWVTHVLDKAKPYGQGWEQKRVDAGDTVCQENQLLHSQRVDNVEQARHTPFYDPSLVDPLNPEKFVGDIDVPVFLAGAWQDEQTGPFFGILLDRFTKAPALRMTVQNGVHVDQYSPSVLYEWTAFLDLFVAKQIPKVPDPVRALGPILFNEVFHERLDLPPERFGKYDTYEAALAAWMAEPKLRVLFESGAGGKATGAPVPTFEKDYPAWPPTGQKAERWYFDVDGKLSAAKPSVASAASEFLHDPAAGQRGILAPGGDVWASQPDYDWKPIPAGSAAVFVSEPLADDLVMAGTGSADLWIRSTATEADLEVNLTEVRPDGKEMYVQSGWLRASQRKLGPAATELYPAATHLEEDNQPLVPGEWVEARVAIAPFGHVFRKGSRIRLGVDTPGDSRAEWRFLLAPVPDGTKIAIGHDADHASSVALPVLEGTTAPSPLPPCVLRGQQCRDYVPFLNVSAP